MNTRVWKFQNKVLRNLRTNKDEGRECWRKLPNEKLDDTFRLNFFRGWTALVGLGLLIVKV
jgi:hypothetical protein